MKIIVDRESICMGDDVLPHKVELEVSEDTEWLLRHGGQTITSYHTETKELTNPNFYLKDLIHQSSRGNEFVWIYRLSY